MAEGTGGVTDEVGHESSRVREAQGHGGGERLPKRGERPDAGAGRTCAEKTIRFLTLNVDGLRSKADRVVDMVGRLEELSGEVVTVLGLVETKLPADEEAPVLEGFYVGARKDRTVGGGGGVIIYVRDAFVSRRIDGPPGDRSETVVVALWATAIAPRDSSKDIGRRRARWRRTSER